MKTDDFNDTMRNEGDDAARDHFDNQRKRYHRAEDQPGPDRDDASRTGTGNRGIPFELPCDIGKAAKPWVIKKVMALGEVSSWIGPPGGAKSALLTDAAIHVANGTDWRGYKIKQQRGAIYFALERVGLVLADWQHTNARLADVESRMVGVLRLPAGPGPHPAMIMIPGLDSAKEELRSTEELFLERGIATFSVDGPGQGEAEYDLAIRGDWEVPGAAIIDCLSAQEGPGLSSGSGQGTGSGRSSGIQRNPTGSISGAGPVFG